MKEINESTKDRVESLSPIIDEESEVLVLGTMPGKESLKRGEYYAAPNNSFWKIIGRLFNSNMEFKDYEEKIACLKKHHIALWDTLHFCKRESNLDSDIKEEMTNDIDSLLASYSQIKKIVYNGKKAATYYQTQLPSAIAYSTSSACAKKTEEKIKNWKNALTI
ncbi:DNA-deoxyinosine glycosylase [Bacteroides sp.]|uniref:DNA-deoxyinosine glycosylase n=1 Tax=Bacteroides sp. TaxID=29523 RepID=UPI0023C81BAC|nr:DNA-deoxyinosine glycosylase [Bacteroides sp.]MDE6216865.1 DNA-deoxyinosine glycosylase [Bacteroides sp.]